MKQIQISDVTLRKAPCNTLSFKEKIEVATQLDKLCVDVIETPAITRGKLDVLFLHTIAPLLKNSTLSCEVLFDGVSAKDTFAAIKEAKKKRLHFIFPVSTVQMEYMFHIKPAKMIDLIKCTVAEAKEVCDDIEVSLLDATRSEKEFLILAMKAAAEAGARNLTICDTAGEMLPVEFEKFIGELLNGQEELKDTVIGVECSNLLHMGTACAISCINSGIGQIKTTGYGKECPTLKSIGNVFKAKSDILNASVKIDMTNLEKSVTQISKMFGEKTTEHVFADRDLNDYSEVKLSADSDIASMTGAIEQLGYDLSDEDVMKVYEEFQKLSEKKAVGAKELDAIVASVAMQVPPTYVLKSYVINNGNLINATAQVELTKNGTPCFGLCKGDGPIDAVFMAIEQSVGMHFELDDFQIQSITEGHEAMGSAIVKLRANGRLYSGKGISTDIVGASIKAFISAINKICFEEEF